MINLSNFRALHTWEAAEILSFVEEARSRRTYTPPKGRTKVSSDQDQVIEVKPKRKRKAATEKGDG